MFNQTIANHKFSGSTQIQNNQIQLQYLQVLQQKQSPKTSMQKNNMYSRLSKKSPASYSDSIQNGYMHIQLMREKERRKLKPNTKNIYTYFPTYTTLAEPESQTQMILNYTMNITQQRKNAKRSFSTQKQAYVEDSRTSMDRRRLSPIKKHSPIQKKMYRPHPNVTFLNVEKVSLIPISKDVTDDKSIVAKNTFNKSGFFYRQISSDQSKIEDSLIQKKKYYLDDSPLIQRTKPFIPPFDRYYFYDFIWKIAHSNGIKAQFQQNIKKKFKIFIGRGNNSMLIKTFFKRRQHWWAITDKIQEANFIWTQIKVSSIHESQKKCLKPQSSQNPKQQPKKNNIYRRHAKIFNLADLATWCNYYEKYRQNEQKMPPSFNKRNKLFKNKDSIEDPYEIKMHNHFPRNYVLGNKKALFSTMKKYYEATKQDLFEFLPLTFHIEHGLEDPEYLKFLNYYYKKNKTNKENGQTIKKGKNIWIVKPGEFSNRGNGIIVCQTLDQIKAIVKQKKKHQNGNWKTYIVQQYLDKPMLYCKRKFDIRHFMLITCINGRKKGYWYKDGYLRTTSYEYSTKNCFGSVHLTNDAIQKNLPDYGKYQKGNKLSYEQFQRYLQKQYRGRYSFFETIYPQMKKIAQDSMRASSMIIDQNSKAHNFEIFGFDFMIDSNFHPWLIQINTNPCLQISCPVLMDIIPPMIQNSLKISIDSVFFPPYTFAQKRPRFSSNTIEQNKFQLLYDSCQQQQNLKKLFEDAGQVKLDFRQLQKDEDQVFEDDGVELDD